MQRYIARAAMTLVFGCVSSYALAQEFYIGEPITKNNLQIVPNYLKGITMEPMPKGMDMSADSIHIEVDVHATKGEEHGFAEDAWIPYLTVQYTLEKVGGGYKKTGKLAPMTAGDGPHYAINVRTPPDGDYKLTYRFLPPSTNGFARHTDKKTGVPAWWEPFSESWNFSFPSKSKGGDAAPAPTKG